MANTITANATGVITTMTLQVGRIVWVGSGTATDVCTIVDNNGRTVFTAIAGGSQYNLEENFGRPVPLAGLNVTAITSGKVTIYYF